MADELRPYEVDVERTISYIEEATLYILARDDDHARELAKEAMRRLPDVGAKSIWWEDKDDTIEYDGHVATNVRKAAPDSDASKPEYIDWSDAIAAERDAEGPADA